MKKGGGKKGRKRPELAVRWLVPVLFPSAMCQVQGKMGKGKEGGGGRGEKVKRGRRPHSGHFLPYSTCCAWTFAVKRGKLGKGRKGKDEEKNHRLGVVRLSSSVSPRLGAPQCCPEREEGNGKEKKKKERRRGMMDEVSNTVVVAHGQTRGGEGDPEEGEKKKGEVKEARLSRLPLSTLLPPAADHLRKEREKEKKTGEPYETFLAIQGWSTKGARRQGVGASVDTIYLLFTWTAVVKGKEGKEGRGEEGADSLLSLVPFSTVIRCVLGEKRGGRRGEVKKNRERRRGRRFFRL